MILPVQPQPIAKRVNGHKFETFAAFPDGPVKLRLCSSEDGDSTLGAENGATFCILGGAQTVAPCL